MSSIIATTPTIITITITITITIIITSPTIITITTTPPRRLGPGPKAARLRILGIPTLGRSRRED